MEMGSLGRRRSSGSTKIEMNEVAWIFHSGIVGFGLNLICVGTT